MSVVVGTLVVVVALLAVLVVGLLRSHAEILRRLHELGAGVYEDEPQIRTQPGVPEPRTQSTRVHDITGTTPAGGQRTVRVGGAGHATLLAFLSSGCSTCAEFWSAFGTGEADRLPGDDTRLVIVTKSADDESLSAIQNLTPAGVTTVLSSGAYDDYAVPVSPYFILVDGAADEIIGEGAAASWPQVRNLLAQAAADAGFVVDARSHDAAARDRVRQTGQVREALADAELAAAGITPGHASLYPNELSTPTGPATSSDEDDR